MTPAEIQGYITIASVLIGMGIQLGGQIKQVIHLFHPGDVLTDAQINAIEQAAVADAERRRQTRIAMGEPTDTTDATGATP
jgi:hypothetical protein